MSNPVLNGDVNCAYAAASASAAVRAADTREIRKSGLSDMLERIYLQVICCNLADEPDEVLSPLPIAETISMTYVKLLDINLSMFLMFFSCW
jgi:hypothetical protein